MADTTSRYSFPYQEAADAPDGPALGQDLAEAVEMSLGELEDRVDDQYAWIAQVRYTSNGSFTKASYPGARKVRVRVQAGGGGSGGIPAAAASQATLAGGGGGGGYAESMLDTSGLASSVTVTVGAGGTAGTSGGGTGGTGGTSSFGAHTVATGGTGGQSRGASSAVHFAALGGEGGGGTAGDLQFDGGAGGYGIADVQLGSSGQGGDSHLGGGGRANRTTTSGQASNGSAGGRYGGGGSGPISSGTGSAQVGAAGGAGIVIVDVYA
jgi:hypothetical protein